VPLTDVAAFLAVLAQDVQPPPGEGPEFGKASPVGLVVVLLLAVATVGLVVSMTRHLKKVPASFEASGPERAADPAEDPEG
jgi:hypothetical protein